MGRKRVRTLLLASVTIMLCMALLIGGTYALWSDKVEVSNHLQAGTLKIKLERTDLAQWKVDERGVVSRVVVSADDKKADFTHDTVSASASKYRKNVFGMDDDELIAPTSKYSATMRIANNGGNIAFDYKVYLKVFSSTVEVDEKLAEQIKVTVTDSKGVVLTDKNGNELSKYLNECTSADGNGFQLMNGKVLVDSEVPQDTFIVTIEFVNDIEDDVTFNNDDVNGKNAKAKFDLFVVATQATEA